MQTKRIIITFEDNKLADVDYSEFIEGQATEADIRDIQEKLTLASLVIEPDYNKIKE